MNIHFSLSDLCYPTSSLCLKSTVIAWFTVCMNIHSNVTAWQHTINDMVGVHTINEMTGVQTINEVTGVQTINDMTGVHTIN